MPAEFESGFFDESQLGRAWHGAGTYVGGAQTSVEAKRLSGLANWDLKARPIYTEFAIARDADPNGDTVDTRKRVEIPEKIAIVRATDHSVLGVVGKDYQIIQNEVLFDFVDALTTLEGNEARWHSAGSLRGGSRVWALLDMPSSGFTIGNEKDKIIPYLLINNAHDGSASCKVLPTTVRVVCMNTLSAALDGRYKELAVNIRHSGDVKHKVAEAQLMLAKASNMFKAFEEIGNNLAAVKVTRDAYEHLINELFPPLEDDASKAAVTRRNNNVEMLTTAVKQEVALLPQYTLTSQAGVKNFNYWEMLNGVTRFADHKKLVQVGKRDAGEARFESNFLGSNAEFKEKASRLILDMAGLKGMTKGAA